MPFSVPKCLSGVNTLRSRYNTSLVLIHIWAGSTSDFTSASQRTNPNHRYTFLSSDKMTRRLQKSTAEPTHWSPNFVRIEVTVHKARIDNCNRWALPETGHMSNPPLRRKMTISARHMNELFDENSIGKFLVAISTRHMLSSKPYSSATSFPAAAVKRYCWPGSQLTRPSWLHLHSSPSPDLSPSNS